MQDELLIPSASTRLESTSNLVEQSEGEGGDGLFSDMQGAEKAVSGARAFKESDEDEDEPLLLIMESDPEDRLEGR